MSVKTRDPLSGMNAEVRADFDRAPRVIREAYLAWWPTRPEPASSHRDTWDAYRAGWEAHERISRVQFPQARTSSA